MLAHLNVREWLHLGVTSKRDDCRSSSSISNARSRPLPSMLRTYCAANPSPFVQVAGRTTTARPGASPSAFSDDGELLTEDPAQCGPFLKLSIETAGNNCRRIAAAIEVEAPLTTLWSVLTDYEGLADFLPGLAVCKVEDRWENGARLFQIGEQNLVFGLKFKAKGVINVKENPTEILPSSICRRIDFEMIEGDFQIFKGSWQMEQVPKDGPESASGDAEATLMKTILTYVVNVQPKAWLPVRLVEGILSKEIQNNLLCVRNQALQIMPLLPVP